MDWKLPNNAAARTSAAVAVVAVIPAVVLFAVTSGPPDAVAAETPDDAAVLETLEARSTALAGSLGELEVWYRDDVVPVEQVLQPFHEDERWVRRLSLALVREARQVDMDPRVLASVLLVENPWLDPTARSPQGAVGLMQVMPFHAGGWGCASADLTAVEANICHGARIFAHYLDRHDGDIDRALLAYNGCVRGINTPNCHTYPGHVYARAGRAAFQRWLSLD